MGRRRIECAMQTNDDFECAYCYDTRRDFGCENLKISYLVGFALRPQPVHELARTMKRGIGLSALVGMIHVHPTFSESIRAASEKFRLVGGDLQAKADVRLVIPARSQESGTETMGLDRRLHHHRTEFLHRGKRSALCRDGRKSNFGGTFRRGNEQEWRVGQAARLDLGLFPGVSWRRGGATILMSTFRTMARAKCMEARGGCGAQKRQRVG